MDKHSVSTLTPPPTRAVAQRGDDVRALVVYLWAGCDQTALWSMLGFHIAGFPLFSPDRDTDHHACTVYFWLYLANAESLRRVADKACLEIYNDEETIFDPYCQAMRACLACWGYAPLRDKNICSADAHTRGQFI